MLKAGKSIAAKIAMIAITTSNSIRVNAPGKGETGRAAEELKP